MKKENVKVVLKVVIPLILALLSLFVISRYASSADFHAKTIEHLDEKKTNVLELTAASTALSTAITLIPGDAGNPVAEKLMDLSSYFIIVLAALYLEKYLLTITGYLTFTWLIPAACVLFAVNVFWKREILDRIVKKLVLFGLAIVLVIPSSIKVSRMIEDTYQASIDNTLESTKQAAEEIEENAEEEEGIQGLFSKIKNGVSSTFEKMESVINNYIEAFAVMLVTSCLLPILVLLFFTWLVKLLLGVNINIRPVNPGKLLKGQKGIRRVGGDCEKD